MCQLIKGRATLSALCLGVIVFMLLNIGTLVAFLYEFIGIYNCNINSCVLDQNNMFQVNMTSDDFTCNIELPYYISGSVYCRSINTKIFKPCQIVESRVMAYCICLAVFLVTLGISIGSCICCKWKYKLNGRMGYSSLPSDDDDDQTQLENGTSRPKYVAHDNHTKSQSHLISTLGGTPGTSQKGDISYKDISKTVKIPPGPTSSSSKKKKSKRSRSSSPTKEKR